MTKFCCAHGCKSTSKNNPALKFYKLTTARGSLSEWLQAFPSRYRLDILADVKSGKESPYNICEVHFNQEAPGTKVLKETTSRNTQTKKSYLCTLKQSPVEIVDIQPDASPTMVNSNVKMQPISNAPVFPKGVQPCYTETGAFSGFITRVDVQPPPLLTPVQTPPLITPAMVNRNIVMQPIIKSHVPALLGGAQPCTRDIGTIGGLVAKMNAVKQTQSNTAGFITINGSQAKTNNVANINAVQTHTNTARFSINAAQPRPDNLVNTGFCVDSPGGLPTLRPKLDTGLANRNLAPIRVPSTKEIRSRNTRTRKSMILRKIMPAPVPRDITVNALHTNVQPTNIVRFPRIAPNNLIQQSNNSYIPGSVATDNVISETIEKAFHRNDSVTENDIMVDDYSITIEDDGIQEMDTGNDDDKTTELKIFDTDQDENDLIKIEFNTDEDAEHVVKLEVEESKDGIESYCFFGESDAKRINSETSVSDFKIVKLEIDHDHDYI